MHLLQTTFINLSENIKHNKHADTCDTTTAVSRKKMQYHISLHSIAGEE